MTTDPEPMNQSDLDDEVTLAASDQTVHEMRAETRSGTKRERSEMSVWTIDDTSSGSADDDPDADPGDDPGLADEPTVIRGFGDEPATPLDDRVKSQLAAQQLEAKPVHPVVPADPAPSSAGGSAAASGASRASVATGPSLIDGVEPPTSDTAFFRLDEIAPDSRPEVHTASRGNRFPIALLALAVLVVAVTVTVVLAVLLGSAAL